MANIMVKDLPAELPVLGDDDYIPVEDMATGETKKVKKDGIVAGLPEATATTKGMQSATDKAKYDKIAENFDASGNSLDEIFPSFQRYKAGGIDTKIGGVKLSDIYKCIKTIRIYGSDPSKLHKLFLISRNGASTGYRIIIAVKTGATWAYLIDALDGGTITENSNGVTSLNISSGNVVVYLEIDYTVFPDGYGQTLDLLQDDPVFRIKPECIQGYGKFNDLVAAKEDAFKCFERYDNGAFNISRTMYEVNITFAKLLNAFKDIKIYGSDKAKPHKIRFMARNSTTGGHGYRILISRLDSGTWNVILDENTPFAVTEATGITEVYIPKESNNKNNGVSLRFRIDYKEIPDNSAFTIWSTSAEDYEDGQKTPAFIISPSSILNEEVVSDPSANVQFNSVKANVIEIAGEIPTGTKAAPPAGLQSGDQWADTTDSATDPVMRIHL